MRLGVEAALVGRELVRGDVDVDGTQADLGPRDPDEVQLIPGSPA